MTAQSSMFGFAALAFISFFGYFAVVLGFLPFTPYLGFASLALDAGFLLSLLTLVTAGTAIWKHRGSVSRVSVCVVTGLFVIALSALALYATRYI